MSQYPQPPYPSGMPEFTNLNSSGQPLTASYEGNPTNPPLRIPLGPVVPPETVQEALSPLYAIAHQTSESVKVVVNAGEDGDNEGGTTSDKAETQHPKKCVRTSGNASKRSGKPAELKPEGTVVHIMKDIVREEILYQGCKVTKMDELKPGLLVDEDSALKKRIQEGSNAAWRPDFMLRLEHECSRFYVDKIVEECLKNPTDLWYIAQKSVKKALDPVAKAKSDQQTKAGIRAGHRDRVAVC
ncbi:hypothetical protein B0J17DRAFT_723802 [Rhizoctonia solani]|nr:hypothetical protein B0J17DRAFT_723802 [Rhizoctonia solani]